MLSSCHLPGIDNKIAYKESRNFDGSTEWSLTTRVFEDIRDIWGPFQIDLFASTLNCKVPEYVSWDLDPGARFMNAFHMTFRMYGVTVTLVEIMQGTEGPFSGICYLKASRMLPRYSFSNKNLERPQEH